MRLGTAFALLAMFYLWDGFLLLLAKYSILCSLGKLRTAHNHCQKHQSNEMVPPVSLMVCGLAKIDSPFGLPLRCFYPLLWSAPPPPRILPCHQQNSLNWKTCRANLFVFKWHWSHTRLISCHHLLRLSIWTYKDGISNFRLRKHHSSTLCLCMKDDLLPRKYFENFELVRGGIRDLCHVWIARPL